MPAIGQRRVTTEEYRRRECDNCGEDATIMHGFLLHNCRRNPASTAYGRDDCSYCMDAKAYACADCDRDVQRVCVPNGMEWASTTRHKEGVNDHLFGEWVTVPTP